MQAYELQTVLCSKHNSEPVVSSQHYQTFIVFCASNRTGFTFVDFFLHLH